MSAAPQDRRVQKTRHALREALASLIAEKPYDEIAVKEVLDRANVGRSTFYMHFRDKDELLLSGIHDMIGTVAPPDRIGSTIAHQQILWFSLPIFDYHYQHRPHGKDRMGIKARALLHEHLRKAVADAITDVLKRGSRAGKRSRQIPPDLLSGYIASTFVLVLNWWVDCGMPMPPKQVNEVLRALVLPSLAQAWQ